MTTHAQTTELSSPESTGTLKRGRSGVVPLQTLPQSLQGFPTRSWQPCPDPSMQPFAPALSGAQLQVLPGGGLSLLPWALCPAGQHLPHSGSW